MKYKMILFDLDGTTLDTLKDLTDSVNYVLKNNGYPLRTVREIRSYLGNGIQRLIELSLPADVSEAETEKVYNEFLPYYKEHALDETKAYDGITDTIIELKDKGYLTALVSNKADVVVQKLVNRFFNGLFDFTIGQKDGINRKPAPDMVNLALNTFNVQPGEALYIGDSEVDVETARNALMDVMCVSYGFRDKEDLIRLNPDFIVDSPTEILKVLNKLKGNEFTSFYTLNQKE